MPLFYKDKHDFPNVQPIRCVGNGRLQISYFFTSSQTE